MSDKRTPNQLLGYSILKLAEPTYASRTVTRTPKRRAAPMPQTPFADTFSASDLGPERAPKRSPMPAPKPARRRQKAVAKPLAPGAASAVSTAPASLEARARQRSQNMSADPQERAMLGRGALARAKEMRSPGVRAGQAMQSDPQARLMAARGVSPRVKDLKPGGLSGAFQTARGMAARGETPSGGGAFGFGALADYMKSPRTGQSVAGTADRQIAQQRGNQSVADILGHKPLTDKNYADLSARRGRGGNTKQPSQAVAGRKSKTSPGMMGQQPRATGGSGGEEIYPRPDVFAPALNYAKKPIAGGAGEPTLGRPVPSKPAPSSRTLTPAPGTGNAGRTGMPGVARPSYQPSYGFGVQDPPSLAPRTKTSEEQEFKAAFVQALKEKVQKYAQGPAAEMFGQAAQMKTPMFNPALKATKNLAGPGSGAASAVQQGAAKGVGQAYFSPAKPSAMKKGLGDRVGLQAYIGASENDPRYNK